MVTVQDLINLHKAAQQYEYEYIVVQKVGGGVERYSNVNNLVEEGASISFISTTDIRDIYPQSMPKVREVYVLGNLVEKSKRIM